MKALLKVAGIESHYTLVYGNESPPFFIPGFSSVSQFNHAILSVPMQTDTVWLECTDQKIPFGYLGAFTDDRYALQITDNGGQLVRTPVYSINDNIVLRNAKVDLNTTTDAVTEVNITAQGEKYENYAYTDELAETELQEWLNGLLSSPNFKLNSFTVNRLKQNIPEANVNIKLLLNRFASKSEKRMFITPYLFYPIPLLPNVAQWKTPIYIERSEQYLDSVTYFIPATYNIETLPVETNLQTKFGDYYSAIRQENGKLIYIRKFSLNKGTYPETDHVELREFLKKATKADKQKVVFIQG